MRPASAAQRRLCAIDELAVDGRGHAVSVAWALDGDLDTARLRRALRACVDRHEILRSRFVVDAELLVCVEPEAELELELVDLSSVTAGADDAGVSELALRSVAEAAARPLPRDVAPLVRVRLLRLSTTRHVLVLTAHRAVADACGLARLTADLFTGAADGPAIDPRSESGPQDDVLAYWRRRFADARAAELRTDRPRPPAQSYRGATHRLSLGADLARRLRLLGRQHGVELPTVLLAGLMAVPGNCPGGSDAFVGWQATRPGFGPPPNTVVLRGDLRGALRWRDLVVRVAAELAAARAHEVAFEELVGLLQATDDPSRHPICQVGFEAVPGLAGVPDGIRVRWIPMDDPVAVFDLRWTVYDDADDVPCAVQYATDLWHPTTVERIGQAWLQVLLAMAAEPDGLVDDLCLLSPAERVRLDQWNDTVRALPEPCTVDGLVHGWARRTPDRVALTDPTAHWTYADLDRRADQVARALVEAGVGVESRVGIHLRRGADLVVSMLGVLKAGGSYLVLDPAHPAERLSFMVRDGGVAAVLTGDDVPAWLPATGVTMIALASTAGRDGAELPARSSPDAVAAVMYTSGSTGRPKGVGVEHRGMVRLVTETDYVAIGSDDVFVHLGDPSFDITIFEVWGALCNGARVAVLPGGEPLGPEEVRAVLRELRPTILALTGTLFNRVVDLDPGAFRDLRYLFVVGEVMDPGRSRRVLREGPPGHLVNGYGPTENTTFSTCYLVDDLPERAASVPIGSAITNTTLHVVDPRLRPVPIGFPGELYVGGAGLARGYLGRPELTAERFVPDPFTAVPGQRLYRTGDLVRWRTDGALEFLGRVDHQVKVRGYRIETGEIEAALLATDAIRECFVGLVEVSGDNRLVAYVVSRDGRGIRVPDLVAELRRRLPAFMLPNHFVALDRLPTTASGKLDVHALPGVPASLPVSDVDRTAPRTPLEQTVWEIWADVLEVREFGVHDNFFLLGGHSLLAIVVVSEVGNRLGVDVPARVIFESRTIAGLAVEIERRRTARLPDEVDGLVQRIEELSRQGHSSGAEGNM
jgi:amino acid adenylation domain-containing protein